MITVISGTNRPDSLTATFSAIYFDLIKAEDPKAVFYDLESLPAEILHTDVYDKQHKPESILKIQREVFQPSEKFIFIFPEYNGSFPGILKLLIDVMDTKIAFSGKKAALIGISTGRAGNLRGLDQLSSIMHHMNVTVMPFLLPVSRVQDVIVERSVKEDTLRVIKYQINRIIDF